MTDVLQLEFEIKDEIDEQNNEEDTVMDAVVYKHNCLSDIHNALLKIVKVSETTAPLIYYSLPNSAESLDMNKTFEELGIKTKTRIFVCTQRKKKRRHSYLSDDDNDEDPDDDITIICYTRIFESEGIPMRKIKVTVKRYQSCACLLEDVSRLWGRDNLKFRWERIVLTREKTFAELNITDLAEILVTGARG
jgi:hypothetical protein